MPSGSGLLPLRRHLVQAPTPSARLCRHSSACLATAEHKQACAVVKQRPAYIASCITLLPWCWPELPLPYCSA